MSQYPEQQSQPPVDGRVEAQSQPQAPVAERVSRREFLAAGIGAIGMSAAIFRLSQGSLRDLGQMVGVGLQRELPKRIAVPRSEVIDPVAHALNRMTFGPGPGDYERVRLMGVDAWLEAQLAPERLDDGLCDRALARFTDLWCEPLGEHYEEDDEALPPILRRVTVLRAVYSERQLFEVMCEFWSDHFNIDPTKGDCRYAKPTDDALVIRKHAMGNFRELLKASALSPAMLWYLDGRANVKRSDAEKPNENYARELMELHTLGVHGGYTQRDVMEVARCLTGWTILAKKDDGFSGDLLSPMNDRGKVVFRKEAHDAGAKLVLGQEIPAGLGEGDLDRVIAIVAAHPSTARYIATKLCGRFIADTPPESAVQAVAAAFTESSGDIKTVLRALFRTPEFAAAGAAKLKRPFHFVVSALRATNASTDAGPALMRYLERMGHMPFRYPTPDGYPAEASHWHATLLWRWKFALALANGRIKGTAIQPWKLRTALGGDKGLMASLCNRLPDPAEAEAFTESGDGLALMLAAPVFQRC